MTGLLIDNCMISLIQQDEIESMEQVLKRCGLSTAFLRLFWYEYMKVQTGEEIVGCAALIPKKEGVYEAKSIGIMPSYRSLGIFDLLLEGPVKR